MRPATFDSRPTVGGLDLAGIGLLLVGWLTLYADTYLRLSRTIWAADEQGHGPIIMAVVIWLFWSKRDALRTIKPRPSPALGTACFLVAMMLYVVGRSQAIYLFEVGSQIPLLASFLLFFYGRTALRVCWFPLFFLVFAVPLPATWVATITTPLKSAVSAAATQLLRVFDYPVARSGVVMSVGQYQLLVADACAGLHSMFTLEALGLLYQQMMRYTSVSRNIFLAIVVVPISFIANVVRVIILVLVTYYFGDEAGQGFVHGFAGMLLFLVALTLTMGIDHGLNLARRFMPRRQPS